MKKTTISRNGMTIDCYGQWCEISNCLIVGDWANGDEMEEIWAGDRSDDTNPCTCWTEVVEHLSGWAKACGHTIYELSAV